MCSASERVSFPVVLARRRERRSSCPINVSLEIFGDRWSLLIVRDLMFSGRSTYKAFAESGEGIATNVLADRLERLEAHGIIARRPDPADGRRSVYRLTRKGIDLAPVLVEMILWAARHEPTAAPPALVREMETHRARFIAALRKRWERPQTPSPKP